jgi:hypothetical protein
MKFPWKDNFELNYKWVYLGSANHPFCKTDACAALSGYSCGCSL